MASDTPKPGETRGNSRLPLGNDSADAIAASLDTAPAELVARERVTRSTDFGQ
jgi:hypothetical protein